MKINGPIEFPQAGRGADSKPAGPRSAERSPQGAGAPGASISDLASRLQALELDVNNSAPLDTARVEEIKQAMRDGQFKVDAGQVADRLIESLKELLGRKA